MYKIFANDCLKGSQKYINLKTANMSLKYNSGRAFSIHKKNRRGNINRKN